MARRGIFVFLLLVFAACLEASPKKRSDALLQRGEMFYGVAQGNFLVGDLDGARTAVLEALENNPAHGPSLNLLARIQFENGEHPKALETIDAAIAAAPDDLGNRLVRAMVLGRLERTAEAVAEIEYVGDTAEIGSTEHLTAKKLIALLQAMEGNWEEAARGFQHYFEQDTSNPEVMRLAGAAWAAEAMEARSKGDFEASLKVLDNALAQMKPGEDSRPVLEVRSELQMLRGQTRARAGDTGGAIEDLREATIRDPENLQAALMLAALYAAEERWESLDALIQPIAADPRLEDVALYLEGRSAFAKGRIGTARARFELALDKLRPGAHALRPALEFYRGACLVRLGRIQEGDTAIIDALDLGFSPESEDEAVIIGRTLLRADRIEEVIGFTRQLALSRSPNPEIWTLLGMAHEKEGSPELALSAYTQAIDLDPLQADARVRRAGVLRAMGEFEVAALDYEAARRASPNPAIDYALGLVRLQQGLVPEAVACLRSAAEDLTSNAAAQLVHAICADAAGAGEEAEASLARYFKLAGERPNESALLVRFVCRADADDALGELRESLEKRPIYARNDLYELLLDYYSGTIDMPALLSAAGHAINEREARKQICEIAYWMSRRPGEPGDEATLLRISVESGQSQMTEYQLAKWRAGIVNSSP